MSAGSHLQTTFLHLGQGLEPEVLLLSPIFGKASPSTSQQPKRMNTVQPLAACSMKTPAPPAAKLKKPAAAGGNKVFSMSRISWPSPPLIFL